MIHKTSDYDSDIVFAVLGSTRPDRQRQIANGWKRPKADIPSHQIHSFYNALLHRLGNTAVQTADPDPKGAYNH